MYYVYIIESNLTDKYYIGYTNNYKNRWRSHKFYSKFIKNKFYDCTRKYGFDNFEMILIKAFDDQQEAYDYEISLISLDDANCLNLAPGGESQFTISDRQNWLKKLSISRKGHQPALGMKHSEENKKKFSDAGKKRWDIHGRYPFEITQLSFKEANEKYGISKTHYYRLLKQVKSNDLD